MTQPTLPGLAAAASLTPRQQYAYDVIRREGPISHETLGAYMCARKLQHSHLQSCRWDRRNGIAIGRELRNKRDERGEKLVRWRKGEGWYAPGVRPEPDPEPAGECCGEFPYCGCAA